MSVIRELFDERPPFHVDAGRDVSSLATEGTLHVLADCLHENMRTIETGCGASTVVFACGRTTHTAISPSAEEQDRVRRYCAGRGIATDRVSFVVGRSDNVLPSLDGKFDVAFIDGAHSFPYPVVDWHYAARLLRLGGLLFLDDAPVPAVATVVRHLTTDPAWELMAVADDRAVVWQKKAEQPPGDLWWMQGFNRGYPDYSFLSIPERIRVSMLRGGGVVRGQAARVLPDRLRRSLRARRERAATTPSPPRIRRS